MATRKAIGKKVRFEVFKRDSFTCQYCGRTSPEVILHVDHINPVSKGGANEIINLITSCADCNLGKSNIQIDDQSVLSKQTAQLKELNEKREQLAMMVDWRNGLRSITDECAGMVKKSVEEILIPFGYAINETGMASIKKWAKKYSVVELLDAVEISSEKLTSSKDPVSELGYFFDRIPKIAAQKRLPELTQRLNYAKGILRKRIDLDYSDETLFIGRIKTAVDDGADIEEIIDSLKRINHRGEFFDLMRCY